MVFVCVLGREGVALAKILVIDPDREILEIVKVLLSEEGFDVATAADLAEADGLLQQERFDLILTEAFEQEDYLTFDAKFLETLYQAASDTPVILFSVFPSVDQVRPEKYGLAGVVPKPFDVDKLLAKIEKALRDQVDRVSQD